MENDFCYEPVENDWIKVNNEDYLELKEKLERYEKIIDSIKDVLYGEKIEGLEYKDDIEEIKEIIEEIEK